VADKAAEDALQLRVGRCSHLLNRPDHLLHLFPGRE